mgnify:CR=1 FL=1
MRQNFDFCDKISIFEVKLVEIAIFGKTFYIWLKFRFLAEISIIGENIDFRQSFDFWLKFRFFAKITFYQEYGYGYIR